MKKKFVLLFLFFFSFPLFTFAHPPQDIEIIFDLQTRVLKAKILHPVKDPQKHFIKKVEVGLNGKEIIVFDFFQQKDGFEQVLQCRLKEAETGDILSVLAHCSISGKLQKEIKVTPEQPPFYQK